MSNVSVARNFSRFASISVLLLIYIIGPVITLSVFNPAQATSSNHTKVYICHETGSSKNPWNVLHVSSNGWDGHRQHHDDFLYQGTFSHGNPIESWCASHAPQHEDEDNNHDHDNDEHGDEHHGDHDGDNDDENEDHGKLNICHATGSSKNPWNAIRIDDSAWNSHKNHGDFKYFGPTKSNGQPTNNGDEWCEDNEPVEPTPTPTSTPSCTPSTTPTEEPTGTPTTTPTEEPTGTPTTTPTEEPTGTPTTTPTEEPTGTPTTTPTEEPTGTPTTTPTEEPTGTPTTTPTEEPTGTPTTTPTEEPTGTPTGEPTNTPTTTPTTTPTGTGTTTPTTSPTGGTGSGEEVDDPESGGNGGTNIPPVTTPTVIAQGTTKPTPTATPEVLGERTCTNAVKLIGVMYLDKNKNGNYDLGEQVFSNITGKVTYTLGDKEIFVDHFISDNAGKWEMSLCPGEYNITVNTGSIPRGVVDSADVHKILLAADKPETTAFIAMLATASWNWSWWWLLLAVFILGVVYYLYRRRREYLEAQPSR